MVKTAPVVGNDSQFILDLRRDLKISVNHSHIKHLRKMQMTLLGRDPEIDTSKPLNKDQQRSRDELGRFLSESIGTSGTPAGDIPFYPLIIRTPQDYLKTNPTLNNLRVLVAETRAVDIVPSWTNCENKLLSPMRDAWWKQRSQGIDGYGGWKDDFDECFMDFADLGVGILRTSACEYDDGCRTEPVHYSPLNVVCDPYAKHLADSKWVVFATVVGLDEASDRWPDADWSQASTVNYLTNDGVQLKGVRVLEWYKVTNKNEKVSYVAFLRDFSGPILEQGVNPFGRLPVTFFTNFRPPGCAYPIGLVELGAYEQKEIHDEEKWIRVATNRESQMGITPGFIHPDDMKKINDGEDPEYIRIDVDQARSILESGLQPFYKIERQPISQDHWQRLDRAQQSLDKKSGTGANSSGTAAGTSQPITATEVNEINAGESKQTNFLTREFARGIVVFAVNMAKAAALFDNAPFSVSIADVPIMFNGSDKRLTTKATFSGPLTCVIGDEQLMTSDVDNRNSQKANKALQWLTAVSNPAFIGSRDALIGFGEALGVSNPDSQIPTAPPMPPQMPGAPAGAAPGGPPMTGMPQ